MILARTIKGRGFSEVEDREGWHGKAFPEDMAARAIAELGGESNLIVRGPLPRRVRELERRRLGARGKPGDLAYRAMREATRSPPAARTATP